MIAIMGKSGSGKSTLLNIMAGLIEVDSGEYNFFEKEISSLSEREVLEFRRHDIGIVLQYFGLIENRTVFKNVMLPSKYVKENKKTKQKKVKDILKKLEIENKEKVYPNTLSGGQKQRVAIGRALVKEPRVILADEPTGALDEETGKQVLKLFKQMKEAGITVIIVTHDKEIADLCDRTIRLVDGRVVA